MKKINVAMDAKKILWFTVTAASVAAVTLSFLVPLRMALRSADTKFADIRNEHHLSQKAMSQILDRDIDDLETQLEQSLGKKVSLQGTFEISKSKNGLTATHTEVPRSPIEIATEGEGAFESTLKNAAGLSEAFVYSDAGTLIGAPAPHRNSNDLLFAISSLVKTQNLRKGNREFFVVNAGTGFQVLTKAPSLLTRLRNPSVRALLVSPISKSNLLLITARTLAYSRKDFVVEMLGALATPVLMGALLGSFFYYQRRRRKFAVNWLRDNLENLRFGRLEIMEKPKNLSQWDAGLITEFEKQLCEQSPFSNYYTAKWVNESRRLASWTHFRNTLNLWAKDKRSGTDIRLGDFWFVAAIRLDDRKKIESVVKVFGRAFSDRSVIFNHFSDTEVIMAARTHHFEEWFDRSQKALRAVIDFERIKTGEILYSGFLYDNTVVRSFSERVNECLNETKVLGKGGDNPLTRPSFNFFDGAETSQPLLSLSWLQILSISPDSCAHLTEFDRAMKNAASRLPFGHIDASLRTPAVPAVVAEKAKENKNVRMPTLRSMQAVPTRPVPPPLRKKIVQARNDNAVRFKRGGLTSPQNRPMNNPKDKQG